MRSAGKSAVRAEPRQYALPFGVGRQSGQSCSRENPLSVSGASTVPQTDTRGRVEHTQALGRVTVKELGKMAP